MRADLLVGFLLILCVAIILLVEGPIRRSTPQMIDAIPEGFTTLAGGGDVACGDNRRGRRCPDKAYATAVRCFGIFASRDTV